MSGFKGLAVTTATLAAVGLAACMTSGDDAEPVSEERNSEGSVTSSSPFAGETFYVDPNSAAAQEVAGASEDDAEIWNRIADHGQADWYGDWVETSSIRDTVAARVATITESDAMPVFVVYAIPHRDCDSYSAGGLNDPDAYRSWIDEFAKGIGDEKAAVILEPDALPQIDCLSSDDQRERLEMLAWAVDRLTDEGEVFVYIDAGNSRWETAEAMAKRLREAGVERARGFALNVSNFNSTENEVAYGQEISDRLEGRPFVVDTSRNGLGPSTDDDEEGWCNPPGRALGTPPTAETGHDAVDAYLWVKRPGESDGTCKGGPPAGEWWSEYAYGLAERAPWVE